MIKISSTTKFFNKIVSIIYELFINLFIFLILSPLNVEKYPRTFHVPVVTPWEIEVGLGGRDWEGIFRSDSGKCRNFYLIFYFSITLCIIQKS